MRIHCHRGSNYPLERDPNKIISGCCGPRDGLMRQGRANTMPAFNLKVVNTPTGTIGDILWSDENYDVVVQDDNSFIAIDNI